MNQVVICGGKRTAHGALARELSSLPAHELGSSALRAAITESEIPTSSIEELIMGCVIHAGQGQAPARQAGFGAELSEHVPASTLNKMCGSGMRAVMMGADQIRTGDMQVVATGGMENMTLAPYLLPKLRTGARLGHAQVSDSMFLDGLEDAYDRGKLMGAFAEDCADAYQFTREQQDEYAIRSLSRAIEASQDGTFDKEITPTEVKTRKGPLSEKTAQLRQQMLLLYPMGLRH